MNGKSSSVQNSRERSWPLPILKKIGFGMHSRQEYHSLPVNDVIIAGSRRDRVAEEASRVSS